MGSVATRGRPRVVAEPVDALASASNRRIVGRRSESTYRQDFRFVRAMTKLSPEPNRDHTGNPLSLHTTGR